MDLFYRDEHVASKEHARNTILIHDTIDTGDVAADVASSPIARCTSYYRGIHPVEMKVPVMEYTLHDGGGDGGVALGSDGVGGNRLSGESTVPGLSQATPSQQTDATSNSPAISKVWTCTVCFKTMATGSQRSHLEGIKHRNREQKMRQDAAEKHPKSEDHQQVQVEVREESSVDEVEHRRGGKHPRDCRICARVVVALSELSPVASATSETSDDEPDIDEESFLEAHLSADRQPRVARTRESIVLSCTCAHH